MLYSRVVRELVDLGHFTLLEELEFCEFIHVIRKDVVHETIVQFLIRSSSETPNPSRMDSSSNLQVLGGEIPKNVSNFAQKLT